MRRIAVEAAARHHRMHWVARWAFRSMIRLRVWRERLRRLGRGSGAGQATPAAEQPAVKPAAPAMPGEDTPPV